MKENLLIMVLMVKGSRKLIRVGTNIDKRCIMTNLIIDSFSEDAKALEASQKLSDLESIGDITIYERVLVKKNADGAASLLQSETTGGLRTLSGMAVGSMVGSLAGPVGLMAGMLTGTLSGAALEEEYEGFSKDFVTKAVSLLQPGTSAVIAEMDEDSDVFVDGTLKPLGGTLVRTDVDYEYDKYSDEQIDAFNEEIAEERAKLKSARDAEKAKIKEKIAAIKAKRQERVLELKEKIKDQIAKIKTPLRDHKISRLKSSIERHQTRIAALQKELKEIES
jgi:uncharacterized membrane protein